MPPLNRFEKTVISLAFSQAVSLSGHAATISVDSNLDDSGGGCTLREAVVSLNSASLQQGCFNPSNESFGSNDLITFAPTLTGNTITLIGSQLRINAGKSVTIDANSVNGVTVSANGQGPRLFRVDSGELFINNMVITDGRNARGGAIYAVSSNVELTDCTVSNSWADGGGGGGIYARSSTVKLTNCTVSGNSASSSSIASRGGGIWAINSSSVSLINSSVSGNLASTYGGGISAGASSIISLSNTSVSGNSSNTVAGGIHAATNSTINLSDSTVSNNSAVSRGGITAINQSSISLNNSYVLDNSADLGGGISLSSSSATLINCTVSGNTASRDGGGIYAGNNSLVRLTNCNVSGNSADRWGGGMWANASSITSLNSTVSNNSVFSLGGGVFAGVSSFVSLSNTTVSNNTVIRNGAGIGALGSSVNLINSTVSGNSASIGSAGIDANISDLNIVNSLIAGNQAGNNAEIISISSNISATHSLFGDNGHTNASAFADFTPNSTNITATSDGNRPTALSSILKPLGDNGGATHTHALVEGSPAIGEANSSICAAPPISNMDQRGELRSQGRCDIGSYELDESTSFFVIPLPDGKVVVFEL